MTVCSHGCNTCGIKILPNSNIKSCLCKAYIKTHCTREKRYHITILQIILKM